MKIFTKDNIYSVLSFAVAGTLLYFLIKDFMALFTIYVNLFPVLLAALVVYHVFKFFKNNGFDKSLITTNDIIIIVFLLGTAYAFIYLVGGFEDYYLKFLARWEDYYYDSWY